MAQTAMPMKSPMAESQPRTAGSKWGENEGRRPESAIELGDKENYEVPQQDPSGSSPRSEERIRGQEDESQYHCPIHITGVGGKEDWDSQDGQILRGHHERNACNEADESENATLSITGDDRQNESEEGAAEKQPPHRPER